MQKHTNVIAIIPARGGSKGIPRKNIQEIGGKPLISHSIEAAKQSTHVNLVVVSTDDEEIARIAEKNGAEICWRPAEISGDSASSESALLHVLETYECDLLVFLQCTAPLTTAEDIDGTIEALLNNDADTALAVAPFHYFLWDTNGEGINHDKKVRKLRQERAPQYLETGSVYVMKTQGFLKRKHRFFGKTVLYEVPAERVVEIDEPVDLEIAEVLYANLHNCRSGHQS